MTKYRQIHVKIWKDEWFLDLEPLHKLFYIYLFSNERASISGIYELPRRVMSFESGLSPSEIDTAFEVFGESGKAYHDSGIVLIPNLRKYHETKSPLILTAIMSDFNNIKECKLKDMYRQIYGIDRVSIPSISSSSSSSSSSEEPQNEFDDIRNAVLTVTKLDPLTIEAQDDKRIEKLFQAGYTATQVNTCYSVGGFWFESDWRGKKGQLPTVKDILATIGAAIEWKPGASSNGQPSKTEQAATLIQLVKQYGRPHYNDAKPHLEAAGLSDAVQRMGGWGNVCSMAEDKIKFAYFEAAKQ